MRRGEDSRAETIVAIPASACQKTNHAHSDTKRELTDNWELYCVTVVKKSDGDGRRVSSESFIHPFLSTRGRAPGVRSSKIIHSSVLVRADEDRGEVDTWQGGKLF